MKYRSILALLVYAGQNNHKVLADQPVSCLGSNIYGTWNFHVSNDAQSVNLFE